MSPTRPRAHLLAVAALAAGLPAACSPVEGEGAAAVSPGAVVFSPVAGGLAPRDAGECARRASEMISRLPAIALGDGAAAPPKVDLTGLWESAGGEVVLSLEAKLRSPALRVPVGAHVVATGRAADRDAEIALVARGLEDVGRALASLFALYGGGEAAWIRALDAAEPDEQVLALSLLGDAKSRAAIPAVGRALKDPRERVAEAAADALVAIGDESAVPVLIGSIGRDDLRSEVRVIEAISRIGGKEARAYLEMTAYGHEIAEVRSLSRSALDRMAPGRGKTR